jgi:pyruvate,water dikinase
MTAYTLPLSQVRLKDIAQVGGKNASLGEMISQLHTAGIEVPGGFAVTVSSYREFLDWNKITETLGALLRTIDKHSLSNLPEVALQCRALVTKAILPEQVKNAVLDSYRLLKGQQMDWPVAVRSSATAEDLPSASFAGQHDSFLNINGEEAVLSAVKQCYVSLFNDRAVKYRIDNGFEHMQVGLSVGIQTMIRADEGSAGVIFTIDPETGFKNAIYITGAWGLGENVVQGAVNPDEFWVFKPTLLQGKYPIISRRLGEKEYAMLYDEKAASGKPVKNVETPASKRAAWCLSDAEVLQLAHWSYAIEKHYGQAMDIEWVKDGLSNKMYILQARPETVHGKEDHKQIISYQLTGTGKQLCKGKAVGKKIISGRACIINHMGEAYKLQKGDILVADTTNPDWNALMRKAVSIVTSKGGRTSHASIVARELGIPAVVGTGNATTAITDGQLITVVNSKGEEGIVLEGAVPYEIVSADLSTLASTRTTPLFILADPDKAFELSFFPAGGVGLLRMEFIINNSIMIHPMALVQFDQLTPGAVKEKIALLTAGFDNKEAYFVHHLSEAVAKVAAAFYPRPVILRMSDFKTNEYASLIGGIDYEPAEENPMIGFRGASRYYDERYLPGFALECQAVLRIRNEMGLDNVKLMIPFCRTTAEAKKVLKTMEGFGLKRGENGLEIYVMIEIPANVVLADQFAQLFDGFSIGSNDLTQLTLGLDRDSAIVSHLFDENNEAVKLLIGQAIAAAKKANIRIGLCGQAPSDFPEFCRFLVEQGIDSISFTPDAFLNGVEQIAKAERSLGIGNNKAKQPLL